MTKPDAFFSLPAAHENLAIASNNCLKKVFPYEFGVENCFSVVCITSKPKNTAKIPVNHLLRIYGRQKEA
jgi:hypothetical protein